MSQIYAGSNRLEIAKKGEIMERETQSPALLRVNTNQYEAPKTTNLPKAANASTPSH
jgi:hypothetical protein